MSSTQPLPPPPVALKSEEETVLHGHRRIDEYAWLRAVNWRDAMLEPDELPDPVRRHLEAENAYAQAVMAPLAELRRRLYNELLGRIRDDDASVPVKDGDWYYYSRYRSGGEHPLLCRRSGEHRPEQLLLDSDREADSTEYFRLGAAEHSPDHRFLAWAADATGAEAYTIRVRDLATGEDLAATIGNAHGDFEWAADARTLFYTTLDAEHRPNRVWRRDVEAGEDTLVYEEADPGFFVGVGKTESGRFMLVDSHDHTTSEVWVVPADAPKSAPWVFASRRQDVEYELADHGEHWLILTNDTAEDFRICYVPLATPQPAYWRDLVPHEPGRLIESMLVFRDWLVREELEDAVPRIVVRRLETGEEHTVALDEACFSLDVVPGYEYATDTLRFSYSSFTTPARIYDYDMGWRTRELRKAQEVPSGHDPQRYVAARLFATAADGERVPISLFHRRDLRPDAETPLLLYGYGAYGISALPGFSPNRLSLVDRGFVYAVAHVRGGTERGYRWYRQGKLEHKTNSFSDYIACAEHLIACGYTGAGRIAAHGGSAGGLLVAAVLNRRPELFHAAVADVPFVDVLTTMLDPSLPLTPPEWPEWGNPIEDEAAYRRILDYSPYDNVCAQAYPHILVTAGVTDPRVTYWEPAKWVARLRATKTDANRLLLKINMSAGHGGPGGRFQHLDEVAYRYAFLLWVYGLAD